jgi:hypothetical protein
MRNVAAFLVGSDDTVSYIMANPTSSSLITVFFDIQNQFDIDVAETLYEA